MWGYAQLIVVLGLGLVGVDVREEDEHNHRDEGHCGENGEQHLKRQLECMLKRCWMQRGRRGGLIHTPVCRGIP